MLICHENAARSMSSPPLWFDRNAQLIYSFGVTDETRQSEPAPEPSAGPPPDITLADLGQQIKKTFVRLGPAGPLAIVAASLPGIGGLVLLGSLKWSGAWLQAHEPASIAIYIAGFSILAGLAVLPTYAQALLGGWAFGTCLGSLAAVAGFMGASFIGYVIARRASGDRVIRIIEEHPKWQAVYGALLESGFVKSLLIITLLRLPPNSPFAITNLVMAATRVRPLIYFSGTLIGLTPRTVIAAYVGATIGFNSKPTWMIVASIISAIVVVGIIGTLANQAVAKVTGISSEAEKGS